ncbi:flagellar basal body-associated FliL family protein [Hyphococcus sp.]|uniref:flagellar basal body-associated FliL family protein n=1 Tax=Hyphococcus sp. TaxID=2038636 RepID=UPI002082D969|nr:MAG: hypothetical protein DHS20C04_24980 [Marinicaulis sp.]
MSKDAKPEKAEPESDAPEGDVEGEETAKKKGLGLIPMVAAAVVAAGVAGGAAFVLAPGGSGDAAGCIASEVDEHGESKSHGEDAAHGDEATHADAAMDCAEDDADDHGGNKSSNDSGHGKKEKKKSSGGHGGGDSAESTLKPIGEVQHSEHATFLVLEPMIVSIQPIGRSKHLKVSLVLETNDDGAAALQDSGPYVQDVLNTYLRSVDVAVLEDPAAMSRLRSQILRRIRAIVPDAEVTNVLITEFILT